MKTLDDFADVLGTGRDVAARGRPALITSRDRRDRDQAHAMTTIALGCISQTNDQRATPVPLRPAAPTTGPSDNATGWLILQAGPLADGTTEYMLLGAAANPRLAFADARRRCETVGCSLPDDAHTAPSDPAASPVCAGSRLRPMAAGSCAATGRIVIRGCYARRRADRARRRRQRLAPGAPRHLLDGRDLRRLRPRGLSMPPKCGTATHLRCAGVGRV